MNSRKIFFSFPRSERPCKSLKNSSSTPAWLRSDLCENTHGRFLASSLLAIKLSNLLYLNKTSDGGFPENPPSDVLLKYRRLLGLVNNKDEARNRPWVLSHRSDLNQAGGAYLAPKMLFLERNPKFIFGLHILP